MAEAMSGAVSIDGSAPVRLCDECGSRHVETVACDPWAPLAEAEMIRWHIEDEDGSEDAAIDTATPATA